MQKDTRRLTVARDHLQCAYEEITRAIGLTERSMAEQAAVRGRDQLDMVLRKLQDEAIRAARTDGARPVEQTLSHSRHAWQSLHDALNDWQMSAPKALDEARNSVLAAIETVETAEHVRR